MMSASLEARGLRLALLTNLGGLTNAITEVVQLRTTNITVTNYLDLCYSRSMHREGALDANAVADFTNCVGL